MGFFKTFALSLLLFASPAFAATYFSLPSGSGTACSLASPCSLPYALSADGPLEPGDTLCISQGANVTYQTGPFSTSLDGSSGNPITIRSCDATGSPLLIHPALPGWATIDSFQTHTLAEDLDDTETQITLTTPMGPLPDFIAIGDEVMDVLGTSSGTSLDVIRGASATFAAAHANGTPVYTIGTSVINLAGSSHLVFRDFEAMSSNPTRDTVRQTTLAEDLDDSETTVTLARMLEGSSWQSITELRIGDERMQVVFTGTWPTVNVNVLRGWEGTDATSHSNGAVVEYVVDVDAPAAWEAGAASTLFTNPDGDHNSFINLLLHDNHIAIFSGSSSSNTEIYGVNCYYNGMADNNAGQCLYLENESGYSKVTLSTVWSNASINAQMRGVTGYYVGGEHVKNVYAMPAAYVGPNFSVMNILYGAESTLAPDALLDGNWFYSYPEYTGGAIVLGYGHVAYFTFTNNKILGGADGNPSLTVASDGFEAGVVSGNKFHTTGTPFYYATPANRSATYTVNEAVDDSETAITLATASGLTSAFPRTLKIGDEYVRVTAVSGNDITVTRGYGSTTPAAHANGSVMTAYTWDENVFYNMGASDVNLGLKGPEGSGFSAVNFAAWQAAGFDVNGSRSSSHMPDTVEVETNAHHTGRCRIVSYAPSEPSSIEADLSACGLADGQAYTIVNLFDPKGASVSTGTYEAADSTVSISLGVGSPARSMAEPVGTIFTTPDTPAPQFALFEVLPGAVAEEEQERTRLSGGVALSGGVSFAAFALVFVSVVLVIAGGLQAGKRHAIARGMNRPQQISAPGERPALPSSPVDAMIDDFRRERERDGVSVSGGASLG